MGSNGMIWMPGGWVGAGAKVLRPYLVCLHRIWSDDLDVVEEDSCWADVGAKVLRPYLAGLEYGLANGLEGGLGNRVKN